MKKSLSHWKYNSNDSWLFPQYEKLSLVALRLQLRVCTRNNKDGWIFLKLKEMNGIATRPSHSDDLKRLINLLSTAAEIRFVGIKLKEIELKEITDVEVMFKADLKWLEKLLETLLFSVRN